MDSGRLLVFFDGKCPFCIGWVRFLIDRDGNDRFRFAALQSDWTRRFFAEHGLAHPGMGSIVVYDKGELLFKAKAVARLGRALPGIWGGLAMVRHLPERAGEAIYDFIGERRYKWFGRRDRCWVPTDSARRKFLDQEDPVYKTGNDGNQAQNTDSPEQRQGDP